MEELDSTHETRLRNHLNIMSIEQFKDLYLLIDEDDPVQTNFLNLYSSIMKERGIQPLNFEGIE